MKTALLAAIGAISLTFISNSAEAHHRVVYEVCPHDYIALSPRQLNAPRVFEDAVLHGPADDPTGTATGGPSGGIN